MAHDPLKDDGVASYSLHTYVNPSLRCTMEIFDGFFVF